MLFLQGDKKAPESQSEGQQKRPSTMRSLFALNYSADNRMMKQAWDMFVRMIAAVFVSFRLFPNEHPALRDDAIPLLLRDVIAYAYSQLRFTREGAPQVVAFAAVVGMLAFGVLFLISLILSLFVGSAHAQTVTSIMSPVNPDCDLVTKWFDYLFRGQSIGSSACQLDGSSVLIAPTGKGMQNAFSAMLNFFSKSMLVCAGFILIYHLFVIIGDSAHTGKPFGRANALWAPVRLVFAIGLLVPVSTSGLNLGQTMAIQIAQWGSNMASQTWKISIDALSKADMGGLDMDIPIPPEILTIVNDVTEMRLCMEATNAVVKNMYANDQEQADKFTINLENFTEDCPGSSLFSRATRSAPRCRIYYFRSPAGEFSCGKVYQTLDELGAGGRGLDLGVHGAIDAFQSAHQQALQQLVYDYNLASAGGVSVNYLGRPYSKNSILGEDANPTAARQMLKAARDKAISNYTETLNQVLKKSFSKNMDPDAIAQWGNHGWITAGAWFNMIARAQSMVFTGAEAALPTSFPPTAVNKFDATSFNENTLPSDIQAARLDNVVSGTLQKIRSEVLSLPYNEEDARKAGVFAGAAATLDPMNKDEGRTLATMPLRFFLFIVDMVAQGAGLWGDDSKPLMQFGNSANPLAELASFGYRNTLTGLSIVGWAAAGSVLGGVVETVADLPGVSKIAGKALGAAGKIMAALAGLAMFVGGIFVAAGLTLGFVLPLIPFMKFFYNVLTWLLIVLEAVVAAPLFALSHLSPYGEGMPGQAAKGYMLLFSLFLRPTMLVVGLIAGFLFFFLAINLLNATFSVAVMGTGLMGGTLLVLAKIVFVVLYCITAYVCANKCFQTISFFPDRVMEWFGGPTLSGRAMGDAGGTMNAIKMAAGYAGIQGMEKLTGSMEKVGSGVTKSYVDDKKKIADTKLTRKNAIAEAETRGYQLDIDDDSGEYTYTPIPGGAPSGGGGGTPASGGNPPSGGTPASGGNPPSGGTPSSAGNPSTKKIVNPHGSTSSGPGVRRPPGTGGGSRGRTS